MAQYEGSDQDKKVKGNSEIPLLQKIAIVMAAMGDTISGEIMKQLNDYQLESIVVVLADLESIPVEVMEQVIKEVVSDGIIVGNTNGKICGGVDFARAALERACGPHKAQDILSRASLERGWKLPADNRVYSDENVMPNEIWMAVKVFPDYARWALANQGAEDVWKGIL